MRAVVAPALVLLFTTSAFAQRNQSLVPEWESLFNGRDLAGWTEVGNEKWVVEDGAIYGEGITEEYGYLATEKTYRDFHLSLRSSVKPAATAASISTRSSSPARPR